MALKIKTDNRWHHFIHHSDVPNVVLHSQYEHLDEEESADGFFQYKKYWYHLSDFMHAANMHEFAGWDGYASDSYFSGVVIKLSRDGEQYKVGTYTS
jgi:hypothetical protein